MKRVIVHIGRLVLRGIERGNADRIVDGLRAELRSKLAADAVVAALASHRSSPVVRGGRARVPHSSGAVSIGRAVATRIVGGGKA